MGATRYLFSGRHWFDLREGIRQAVPQELAGIDPERLMGVPTSEMVAYIADKYSLDVPVLDEAGITVEQREITTEARHDDYGRRGGGGLVKSTAYDFHVPYAGDGALFQIQPSTSTSMPPSASVIDSHLVLTVEGQGADPESIRAVVARSLKDIEQYLTWLRGDTAGMAQEISAKAEQIIDARKAKIAKDRSTVGALGFPVRQRSDAPKTYVAPEVRRKIAPMPAVAKRGQVASEPALGEVEYDHILSVVESMVKVIERSPKTFSKMKEEDLRNHFLVQLNGQYEGQATGETFNSQGKTDILIRVNDRNIFIGECKFWTGPKSLFDAISQVLSYSSWRDTKVAILLFNRGRDFSKVLGAIASTVESHPQCKKNVGRRSETNWKFLFSSSLDKDRELILTVLAFDIPE